MHLRLGGEILHVTVNLIDPISGLALWSDSFDTTTEGLFELQHNIAQAVTEELNIQLSPDSLVYLTERPTASMDAYKAYLRGQNLAIFYTEDELNLAREHFQRALEIDPDYALALAGLASVDAMYYRNVDSDSAFLDRALDYARRARAIDPKLARAHSATGEIHAVRYEYAEAEPWFREAVHLQPDEPSFHDNLSWILTYKTPPEGVEAEAESREALRLSPRFAAAHYHLGRALLAQDRIDEAMESFEYAAELGRASDLGDIGIGQAWLARGDYTRALDTFEGGDGGETPLELVYRATAVTGLGNKDEALTLLERAVEGGYRDLPYLRASRYFDPLRDDPRFEALLSSAQ